MAGIAAESNTAIDPALSGLAQSVSPALATRSRPEPEPESEPTRSLDPQLAQAALDLELDNSRAQLLLQTDGAAPAPNQANGDLSLSRTNSGQTAGTDILRPLEPVSPSQEGSVASPSRERLPSISQLTQQLTTHSLPALAEAATQQEARQQQQFTHQHSQSYGSNPPQSPLLNHHQQTSPGTFAAFPSSITARSPTTAVADTPYYQSPSAYAPYSFYAHRRPSAAAGDQSMPLPPSLASASSSGDSAGPPASIDGYSTAHTTPIDLSQSMDATPRAITSMLPPPGGFKCPYEGCTAAPFQTQYLLTSHKNVHSQDRPHYCPVKDCPRGEGGKGFKRKNEMIRHGLVHKSPGYICPFCPEREHKYPRPDNLQRHVRVHHMDKHRDDPALQEVLNQRTEGQGKTRRRRTTMTTIAASA